MAIKKILFVTNINEQALSFGQLKNILPMQRLGLEEILFLQTSPSDVWTKGLSELKINSKVLVEKKLLPQKILSIANKEQVSLIVVDLDRKQGESLRASIIKKLIKGSNLPIIFINKTEHEILQEEKGLFSSVVFATDWSPASERAFEYLLDYKTILGDLDIVNVIHKKLTVKDLRELKERLGQMRKICLDEKIDAESHIYAGKTFDEIQTAAKDYRANIIAISGKTWKTNIKERFKQNLSHRIAEEISSSVFVIN